MGSLKRIQKELKEITLDHPDNISAGLQNEDNFYLWNATIIGPADTPYENGIFKLTIKLSYEYPFKPPIVQFVTKIYHCNINEKGQICIDILKKDWTAAITIEKILLSISSLLGEPNPTDPLRADIADMYINNRQEHDSIAKEWTLLYAH